MKVNDMESLKRVENTRLRWICGVALRAKKQISELIDCLGVESVKELVNHE